MNHQAMANIVAYLRKAYPVGCRVMLDRMDDVQAPPIGTLGTVRGVDDTGSIMVAWDNGSTLSVVFEADACHRMDAEAVEHQADGAAQNDGRTYRKLKEMEEYNRRNAENVQRFLNQNSTPTE